jgi:hypothetical protein
MVKRPPGSLHDARSIYAENGVSGSCVSMSCHQNAQFLLWNIIILQRCSQKIRDNINVDVSVYFQAYPPVTRPRAELDRIPGSGAPAAYPLGESPDGIRRLKQRHKRGRVRADRHNGIKGSTAKDGERKRQPLAFEVGNGVKGDRHDHGFGHLIHPLQYRE